MNIRRYRTDIAIFKQNYTTFYNFNRTLYNTYYARNNTPVRDDQKLIE